MKKILLSGALLLALVSAWPTKKHNTAKFQAAASDKVDSLPQMPDLSFGYYSGYVPINGT